MRLLLILLLLLPLPVRADSLLAARTIRAQSVLTEGDVVLGPKEIIGAMTDPAEAIGLEARVTLYAGRPIRRSDLGPAAIVDRNQIVPLIFDRNGLRITTDGRSLARAGPGDTIRVMNLSSRSTLFGTVQPDGSIKVH